MIKYVYLLIVGIALYYGWRRWIARPRDGSGADPTGASPDAERKYLTSEELPALLRRVSDDISSFLDDASHPSECVENPAFRQAMEALARPETPLETVLQYVTGGSWPLSCAAAASLQHRADAREACERLLPELRILSPWPVYFILDCLNGLKDRLPAGAPVAVVNEWWVENPAMQRFFRDHFDKREEFGDPAVFGESASSLTAEQYKFSLDFLNSLRCPFAGRLAEELERIRRTTVDRAFLTTFGRLWQAADEPSLPVEADGWSEGLDAAALTVQRTPPRSLAVSGEQHVGKTSILRLLAHRLEAGGWQIFEAGAADLMAGQQWFGQLEERIKRAIEEVSAEKKLIWYVPDLLQLTASGTHQGQSASIFEQMLPAIASGKLILWTETTPAILSRLLQSFPVLRNLLEVLRVEPMTKDAATDLAKAAAERMAAGAGVTVEQNAIATAIETAPHYIANGNLPGAALTLLKLTVARAAKRESKEVTQQDVLETLSQLTGLPLSILDIDERLAVEEAREFFRKRVIGQDEAIDAIVDRIVMLKAGLNDPGKPIGVFLFAGPTGTGKTELAKTAAEYLFGSPDRLIRLDMSEFQSQEAMAKIIGDGNPADSGSLIARVRKQPFSLVLLDEFEKSHPRIWDLFLQVFDDGRLSDASGQTANFRHCIVVMTSNLGATDHQSAGFGFAPPSDSFGSEQVMRAISQTYRPEFQNRIDRIIVFRPLDRDLMRSILHKELDDLHQRRGLKDRQWAIEWEPSAIEFLLEKGFSADMGARPLKRAVDRYVLSPLAATIVEKRFPDGEQFVFMRSNGNAIQAEFVDPDADDTGASTLDAAIAGAQSGAEHAPPLAQIILSPAGSDREIAAIAMRLQEYAAAIDGPGISGEK
ncbi:MAG: AAA family ATPase, partial [Beijerinckiaceae bacterium]